MNKKNLNWFQILQTLVPIDRYLNNSGIHKAYKLLKSFYKGSRILVFDKNLKAGYWSVPLAWEVDEAKLKSPEGKIIANYFRNPIEVMSNSCSFVGKIKKKELIKHLNYDKRRPTETLFHYRNQFRENIKEWGFSLPYNKVKKLPEGNYEVSIKTKLQKKNMLCAYYKKKGSVKDTLLLASHFDHPYQANDGIAGSIAAFEVIKRLTKKTKLSYAALAAPEIVGSIFFASKYSLKENIKNAIMTSFSAVKSNMIYARSASKNNFVDKAFSHVLKFRKKSKIIDFRGLIGADEIAFDNVAVNVPCGSFYRWPYKHYHTSKDDMTNVDKKSFQETCEVFQELIYILENNSLFFSKFKVLPKLSHPKLNLYITPIYWKGSTEDEEYKTLFKHIKNKDTKQACVKAAANINSLQSLISASADGRMSIFDLAERCKMPFIFVNEYIKMWERKNLIRRKWINPLKINQNND